MSCHQSSPRTLDLQRPGPRFGRTRGLVAAAAAVAVLTSACGADTTAPDAEAGGEVAMNSDTLTVSDDVRLTEVLDVSDGAVQTLRTAVDGDRPVLLWFWAPH